MPRLKATDLIHLTERQKQVLGKLAKQQKAEQRLIERAKILNLADEQKSNSEIANFLRIKRSTVIKWRRRWREHEEKLFVLEKELDEKRYREEIVSIFSDAPRLGAPITFSAEAVCQILAIACEPPEASGRPVTHWSATELRSEVLKRGIVPSISTRTVWRFLKSSGIEAPPNKKLDARGNRRPRSL